jgi:hypothetical protein
MCTKCPPALHRYLKPMEGSVCSFQAAMKKNGYYFSFYNTADIINSEGENC